MSSCSVMLSSVYARSFLLLMCSIALNFELRKRQVAPNSWNVVFGILRRERFRNFSFEEVSLCSNYLDCARNLSMKLIARQKTSVLLVPCSFK